MEPSLALKTSTNCEYEPCVLSVFFSHSPLLGQFTTTPHHTIFMDWAGMLERRKAISLGMFNPVALRFICTAITKISQTKRKVSTTFLCLGVSGLNSTSRILDWVIFYPLQI